MKRTLVASTVLAMVLVPVLSGPASASATSTFEITCDGVVSTLTIGGGPWSAARVLETGQTFVPIATHVYLTDPTSGEIVYQDHDYKGVPRPGSSSCVEEFTASGLLGTFVVVGDMR